MRLPPEIGPSASERAWLQTLRARNDSNLTLISSPGPACPVRMSRSMTPARGASNISETGGRHMHGLFRALAMLPVLVPLCAFAANEKVRVELNSIEGADNRCRLN